MNRDIWIGLAIGAVAGLAIGYAVGSAHLKGDEAPPPAAAPAPIPGAMAQMDAQRRIAAAEAAVAADPRNHQAWLSLGNDFFDTHQPQKSVDAYAKAMALAPDLPNTPDILTDQGVMFRELKQFDKAIANFQKASRLNPRHQQSLYNLGVVYQQDLHDGAKAAQAWNKVLEIDPGTPQANQAREALAAQSARP